MQFKDRYQLYIDGSWRDAEDGALVETKNPATGEVISKIADASKKDVDDAVAAARRAFCGPWRETTKEERSALLLKIADIIDENRNMLATIETMDNGKPIRETMAVDVPLSADHFRYFAGVLRSEEDQVSILDGKFLNLIMKEPIGVVAQIVPWNFPFLMAAWKLAPALAAGDTIVLKPSSSTSLSVLALVELIGDLLPKGVLNVVTGRGSKSGEFLQHHPDIDKIAFTGSTEVGREIGISAAEQLIPATLELGGKSANIIFDDADMEQALDGAQLGILFNQGQVCCAGSRLFVQEGIYDSFVKKLVEKFEAIPVGNPLDKETVMGSQIDERQLQKILSYVNIAKENGATILTGGKRLEEGELAKGAFMAPTIITDQANEDRVCQEEIFGPVVVIQKFSSEDEVVRLANDSDYGLGGGVYTKNLDRALSVARRIRTGRMWVNTYNQIPAGAPFGGYKESGIGRETHKMILNSYCQTKNILIDLTGKPSGFYDVK